MNHYSQYDLATSLNGPFYLKWDVCWIVVRYSAAHSNAYVAMVCKGDSLVGLI